VEEDGEVAGGNSCRHLVLRLVLLLVLLLALLATRTLVLGTIRRVR
jgi:hypothetical protein